MADGILDPVCRESEPPPMMAHSIFFIDTEKKLKLALHYPASVGYDINEIVRCHSALKISSLYSVVCCLTKSSDFFPNMLASSFCGRIPLQLLQ